ncbi:MAG: glycosyltransferase family 39 protein [Elusimicrobia bacterium]|nr:glycosyltransferase family 39 protein [Elusimicrobiota bacterium]
MAHHKANAPENSPMRRLFGRLTSPDRMSSRRAIIFIFSLAFIVRAVVLLTARDVDYGFSAGFKLAETARNFLEGRGLAWDARYLAALNEEAFRENPLKPKLEVFEAVPPLEPSPESLESFRGRPPGYSLVVAATWAMFGKKLFLYSQILFVLLDIAACLLIWWLTKELFGPTMALAAGVLYALSLPHATLSIFPGHDAINAFPVAACLAFFWMGLKRNSWPLYVASGIAAGAGSWIRQEPYLMPVVLAIALAVTGRFKEALRYLVLAQAAAFLTVAPWGLRNADMFGKFQIVSPAYAHNLLQGLLESDNPWGIKCDDQWVKAFVRSKGVDALYHTPEFNKVCMDEFLRLLELEPLFYVKRIVKRSITSLFPTIMPFEAAYTRYWRNLLGREGVLGFFMAHPVETLAPLFYKLMWLFLWIGSCCVFLGINRISQPKKTMIWALAGTTLYYWTTHVPMHLEYRFILPGYFPLMILGAEGWRRMAAWKKV